MEPFCPYLIQRGVISQPEASLDQRVSQVVNFDYMGSAEFEFGALPKSFRAIEQMLPEWKSRTVPDMLDRDGNPLIVWSGFNDEQFAKYLTYLVLFRAPTTAKIVRPRMKEAVRFESDREPDQWLANFWWDIENHTMFGFHPKVMVNLGGYVASSLAYMNS